MRHCAIAWAVFAAIVAVGDAADPAPAKESELIRDKDFQRGFILWKTEPGKEVRYGELSGVLSKADPVWGLYQWSSKFPLDTARRVPPSSDLLVYKNAAKSVAVGASAGNKGLLVLAANTGVEYGSHARTPMDPWVHLLVQQQFEKPVQLAPLSEVRFRVAACLTRSKNLHANDYSPDIHAAQFLIYFTLQNLNRESQGYGDFLWFGIPIFDNRSRFPPAFKERDFGGTAKFIFTAEGQAFSNVSAHDGKWLVIDKGLKPLMTEALTMAWQRGFLRDSKEPADYYLAGMNMGWELPGTFDVEMQIKDVSLQVTQEDQPMRDNSKPR